ncbi:MAG: 4-hydroxy-tetrahydrodipicolinate synthase [Rhodospirillales bacterium]
MEPMIGNPLFRGSCTALITPMKDAAVDAEAFQRFCAWQIEEGTDALVPVGTTGESPTLNHDEHKRVVELCIEVAKGKRPVIAGAGSNATAEAIALTQHAQKAGADAALIVTPYYNKPTQAGLYAHYRAIHDASDIPIVIYNIPGRSIIDLSVETMARLAELPRIVGVKDASNDLTRPARTRLAIDADFAQLSGEDATIMAFLGTGGHGCISVTSNVAPGLLSKMHRAWQAGDSEAALALHDRLQPLHSALFAESSPAPVKYAASLLGLCQNEMRLPLVPIKPETQGLVRDALVHAGLLN